MAYDKDMLSRFYAAYTEKVAQVRTRLARPLTYADKVLFAHLASPLPATPLKRGEDYAGFNPDRVAMQDATAQMALLQFMNAGRTESAVPATVHCDHLICATDGAKTDLSTANQTNAEVYDFLKSAAARYGIGFWRPGAGIIHQIVLENYAFPGGMMVGTDSHTPNAGGVGMVAVGVGGADAVDVMVGMPWELKVPRLIGVKLTGRLSGWASPKDVILKLAGLLTTKGGTNAVIEYFGEGVASLSCTGRATICNMGAEVGATTSIFPYDDKTARYLAATGRQDVAEMASACADDLKADPEVTAKPEDYFDQVIEIDLSLLTPFVNGPFTPDAACTVADMAEKVKASGYPDKIDVVLIGSCTNSSYQDLRRAAAVIEAGMKAGLEIKTELIINPGSELILATAERDGLIDIFKQAGAVIMANACGPCIGQWKRKTDDPTRRNSIITTFNRNFAKRADGNPNTHAFITSPETAAGYAFTASLSQHPALLADMKALTPPTDADLPEAGFARPATEGYEAPKADAPEPIIRPDSERLQRLEPFKPWDGKDFESLYLLIKTQGKCTTDHISMAGPWLRFRGHLENISQNLLLGAVNAFTGQTGAVTNPLTGEKDAVWAVAKAVKQAGGGTIVVAEDNYGEGSSREHAAMEPRFLGVKVILAKSFARIHETNLKKQGVLALTFAQPADYDKILESDRLTVKCSGIKPGEPIEVVVNHADGTSDTIKALHTYNAQQIAWFHAGSALGCLAAEAQ